MTKEFDQNKADSQATVIEPVAPDAFDFDAYKEYETGLQDRCKSFWDGDSGVLVYRRMRVAEVFSYGCRDMKNSLALQLGALQKSMDYPADVPNFLEPWYGIGTVASSFGIDYTWHDGQAPAFKPKFKSIEEALDFPAVPVKDTPIGQNTLKMVDYFLEQTQGRVPMSLCDIQSPFDVSAQIVDMTALLMGLYDCPYKVVELLDRVGMLLADFTREQAKRIGNALVWPGHGFPSSVVFEGFGMSDDNSIMLSAEQFQQFASVALARTAKDFAGTVFHSCGNFSHLAPVVKQIDGLRMVDGAFGPQTDPSPNDAEVFGEVFADSGIIVNARIVGDSAEVARQVRKLWRPGMKLIVTTYCQSPEDQQRAYEMVHEICQ
jgi:hypothetical protein